MSDDKKSSQGLDSLKNSGFFNSKDAVFFELLKTADSFIKKTQLLAMQQGELQKRVEREISLLNTMNRNVPATLKCNLFCFCSGLLIGALSILAIVYFKGA